MKQFFFLLGTLITFISLLVIPPYLVRADATGTAELGDECNVHAEDESHICVEGLTCVAQNEDSEGNGKCENLNPSVTPTPTVEVTPTPTPTEEITPTPPQCDEDECPTPTPEPTITPEPTEAPRGITNASAPTCNDNGAPKFAPTVTYAWRINNNQALIKWTGTDVNDYIIYYTPTGNSTWLWNTAFLGRLHGNEFTLDHVTRMIDVKVCSLSTCGSENCSAVVVDP